MSAHVPAPDPDWYFENVLAFADPNRSLARVTGPVAEWRRWWRSAAGRLDPRVADQVTGFVLLRSAAWASGVDNAEVRRLVRRGTWAEPGPRVVSPVDVRVDGGDDDVNGDEPALRRAHTLATTGALLRRPDQVAGGRSGAIMHGLPTLRIPDRPELVARLPRTAGRHGGALVRSGAVAAEEITSWYGAPVLDPVRVVVDLARTSPYDAIMAADAALRERLVTVADLRRGLDRQVGWPGIRRARTILAIADGRAESPLESVVRLRLHDDGFPTPELQVVIGGFRVDLVLREQRLVIEADGRAKYRDDAMWREKKRERVLRRCGYRVERVIWQDVLGPDWPVVSALLREELRNPPSP